MFLQVVHCFLKFTDDRRVVNVCFTTPVLHLGQHPDQVVQRFSAVVDEIFKSLKLVPKPVEGAATVNAIPVAKLHSWLPPWDCWQAHRVHRDRVSVPSPDHATRLHFHPRNCGYLVHLLLAARIIICCSPRGHVIREMFVCLAFDCDSLFRLVSSFCNCPHFL